MTDENDNPAGGVSQGIGFSITWQNGPLGRGQRRRKPNGAFVEDVILAAIQRLEFFQEASGGKFKSRYNRTAINRLNSALVSLEKRTAEREERKVEGTHEV